MKVVRSFTIGSSAFFAGMEGFCPKDTDELCFVDAYPFTPSIMNIKIGDKDLHVCRDMYKEEFMQYSFDHDALTAGKFLIPDFATFIGMSIDDLESMRPVFDRLDEKHSYEKVIFDAYIENGEFYLTDEQLRKAYEEYKSKRI